MDCLHRRSYYPIRVSFWASCSWWSECLFGQSFSVALPIQTLRGLPFLGSISVDWHVKHIEGPCCLGSYFVGRPVRHLKEHPGWGPTLFDGSASESFSCWILAWKERGFGDSPTHYAWLSSIALLPWLPGFLPQAFPTTISSLTSPRSVSSTVNSSPWPGFAPQTLNSSSQWLYLLGDLLPCLGYVWLWQGLILIPFRLPQIGCFTLSLKFFSSHSDSCPNVGIGPLLQFPHPLRGGSVLLTLLFFPLIPSSCWVLHGSIYSFLLVRYSCLLSAGVLHALLCLKVYPWREMYSMSTYSSTILFSLIFFFNLLDCILCHIITLCWRRHEGSSVL